MACLFGHKWNGCKCEKCGATRDEGHDWDLCKGICKRCGKTQAEQHDYKGIRCTRCGAVSHEKLYAAAKAVFDNPFPEQTIDPVGKMWKEPVQKELDLLLEGGADGLAALEKVLIKCADKKDEFSTVTGDYIEANHKRELGCKWCVKTIALFPKEEAVETLARLLHRDTGAQLAIYWYVGGHKEIAKQLGTIGGDASLAALQKYLTQRNTHSEIGSPEALRAVEKLNGQVPETPGVIIARAKIASEDAGNDLGIFIESLLPYIEQVKTWNREKTNWDSPASNYYAALARCSKRLGYKPAAYAFCAALLAIFPDDFSAWSILEDTGIKQSPENAAKLAGALPIPKTMDEIKDYTVNLDDLLALTNTNQAKEDAPLPGILGTELGMAAAMNFLRQTLLEGEPDAETRDEHGRQALQGYASGKFPLWTGGGICDVCAQHLTGKKAYAVPNHVFYHSQKYLDWCAKRGMSAAFMRMKEAQDTSSGSAICEDCIHMFE